MAKTIQINLNKLLKNTEFENKKIRIGVALSGGRDSIALCHILKFQGMDIAAINVEHGIRGDNSKNDSLFVKEFCNKNDIPLYYKEVDVPAFAKENGYTIEQAARILRYDYFESLLNDKKVDVIALAHHLDDQAETILMRILRGTGVKGLVGMKDVSNRYIRPLLDYSREDIDAYIKENKLSFVDDETNQDTKYTRNYLREELKELKEKYPSLLDSFNRLSRNAEEVEEYLSSITPEVEFDGKEAKVLIPSLSERLIAKRLFIKAINKLGVFQDIEERHFDLIFDLINKENGKRIELTHSIIAHKDNDYIVFSLSNDKKEDVIEFKEGNYKSFVVELIETDDPLSLIKDKSALYLDADKVKEGTLIRQREDGDFIHKFGGGTKNLGDYLTDKKVPLRQRDSLYLVANKDEIYAVIGIDISSSVKIDYNSRKIYKIFQK